LQEELQQHFILQFSLDIPFIIAIIITAAIGVFLGEDIFSCYDNER